MSGTKICPYCNNAISVYALKCQFCGEWQKDKKAHSYSGDTLTQVRLSLSSRYEVLEEIGRGGMAVVYKARQLSLNRLVALKVVHQNLVHDKEFLARFHREAQLSASLDHPNIVTIYDTGKESMVHYVAMEYLEGQTLQKIIQEKGHLEIKESLDYLVPIADALNYAHQKKIIHRDIKSSNIFITQSGRPVLMDFGIAHAASQTRLTVSSSILGTPEYMSPEQADGVQVDNRTDVYSLGIVLYEALTGQVPFRGENPLSIISHVKQTAPEPPSNVNKKVPPWLEEILLMSLAKKPEERIQTAADFVELVRNKKIPPKNRPRNVRFLNIAAILIILIMGGSLAYYFKPDLPGKVIQYIREYVEDDTKNILAKAQKAYNTKQWLSPENKNANYFTNLVLEKKPGNRHAQNIKNKMYTHYLREGKNWLDSGRVDSAIKQFRNAFTVFPDSLEKREKMISQCLDGLDEQQELSLKETTNHYRSILRLARIQPALMSLVNKLEEKMKKVHSSQDLITKGDNLYRNGEFKKALEVFFKIRKAEPGNESVQNKINRTQQIVQYLKRARRALAQNNCKTAAEAYQRALSLDRENQFLQTRLEKAKNCFSIGLDMIYVKGGSYQMGCQNGQAGCEVDEKPVHSVHLGGFYISKYEVTNAQFCHMLNDIGNPERGDARCIDLGDSKIQKNGGEFVPRNGYADHPVSGVTWHGAREFCRWLSRKTGQNYHLPSEAEWEYAARGGQQSKGYIYSGSNNPGQVAWINTSGTHPVGQKSPNELGIHDMSGNVGEWCYDRYDNDYYQGGPTNNPRNSSTGKSRVLRGGHWAKGSNECRVANRTSLKPGYSYEIYGFRVCKN